MLTTQQLQDIEQLQKECEAHDHLQLKLNWEMLSVGFKVVHAQDYYTYQL
jgi:hypothetical protein